MNYTVQSGTISGPALGLSIGVGLVFYLVMAVALWRIFTKAGEAGWLAIIPIVNAFVLVKIAGKSYWWILLLIIPLVNIVFLVMIYHAISTAFGHGAGFTVGMLFLPFIFWPILGFDSSTYRSPGRTGAGHGQTGNYRAEPFPA